MLTFRAFSRSAVFLLQFPISRFQSPPFMLPLG